MKKFRCCIHVKRIQDFHVQLHWTTLMFYLPNTVNMQKYSIKNQIISFNNSTFTYSLNQLLTKSVFCQHKKKMFHRLCNNPLKRHWIQRNEIAHQSKCKFTMKGKNNRRKTYITKFDRFLRARSVHIVVNGKCGVVYI